jgi:hypothetical protein
MMQALGRRENDLTVCLFLIQPGEGIESKGLIIQRETNALRFRLPSPFPGEEPHSK